MAKKDFESVYGLAVADAFELAVELGCRVVGVAVFFFIVGFDLALLYGVVKVGLGEGLEGEESEREGSSGGVKAPVFFVGRFFSAVMVALEKKYGGEEREQGEECPADDEVDVHGRPFADGGSQAWIGAPMKAAATFLTMAGPGLRGRRTLEESGPNVVVGCYNVVLAWLIRDGSIDQLDDEEDGDEEVEGGGVMIACLGKQKKQESEEGGEEGKDFPSVNFWVPCHRWVECIAVRGL